MTEERKQHARSALHSQHGRSYVWIRCPYCDELSKAYVWSLCGSGKRCPCGALHYSGGMTRAPQPPKPRKRLARAGSAC